jgi:BolA protein
MSGVTAADIEAAVRAALQPQKVEVVDDSHLHAGHAGSREGRHFTVRVTADRFKGLSRVARHRLIYDSVELLIPRGIHALAIEAHAPGESQSNPQLPPCS